MLEEFERNADKNHRRSLGVHLTSKEIFKKYILPEIQGKLDKYLWVDLYAGEGNLILPILDEIPAHERINFFENHIFLFDVQPEMVKKCRSNTISYGIPLEIAKNNIVVRDNLNSFPIFLKNKNFPIFHITNPPYLYLGYIRKHEETKIHLKHFEGKNEGYQDLYQIAMINDLRNNVENLIYIIPTNFIFGAAVSNKFRKDFLKYYNIIKMYIFETKIFEFTGTNICISFFNKKKMPKTEEQEFKGIKFKNKNKKLVRSYHLIPKYKYRGGSEFNKFVQENFAPNPLKVIYYLQKDEIQKNFGEFHITVIDTSNYISNDYQRINLKVNKTYYKRITSNILYLRTVDTGSYEGRAGLGIIKDDFDVDGIYVSGNTYRTSPIHIILEPEISKDDQILLKDYFNFILEFFRKKLDSEFLTTYKYSNAEYTRKYLGLTQVRNIIATFPILSFNNEKKEKIKKMVIDKDFDAIFTLLNNRKVKRTLKLNDITSWF
ncbi:MAG: N-6 DNA methylase [Candidatus Thorarchaeota archaeon]